MIIIFAFALVATFAMHYYLFRSYMHRKGLPSDNLLKSLLLVYVSSITIGVTVFFVSLFPLLGAENDVLSLIIWGAGFLIPFLLLLKAWVKTPWSAVLGIGLLPIALILFIGSGFGH